MALKTGGTDVKNKIPKVFICIRLRPKNNDPIKAVAEFRENLERAKIAARYAVLNGYDPEATTIYFTQFLNDSFVTERELGMKIGQERLRSCDEIWCVMDIGESASSGMKSDMRIANANGIPQKNKYFSEMKNWVDNYDKTSH